LARQYDDIKKHGADVVAVGTGDRAYARRFVEDDRIPFLVLVDDDARAATAAGVEEVSWSRLLHPSTWPATRATWGRGYRVHKAGKRVRQLGATFVIGPGDHLRYEHLDPSSVDHAPVAEVMRALDATARNAE
jgi:peroxiredoxin